jgi:hypothetical protein
MSSADDSNDDGGASSFEEDDDILLDRLKQNDPTLTEIRLTSQDENNIS